MKTPDKPVTQSRLDSLSDAATLVLVASSVLYCYPEAVGAIEGFAVAGYASQPGGEFAAVLYAKKAASSAFLAIPELRVAK